MKRDVKKKNCFIALSFVLIFSIFLNSAYAISLGEEKQIKTMEQIVSENLVKTQKVVVKDADTEEVKYERNLTPSPKLRTMSAVSEDVTLVSGESATYYDEYNNIQDLKNAIIENYPEKDDEEVAKDILRALDQDEDVINSITTNEVDVILQYNTAMGASIYYMDNEITDENITVSSESIPITKTQAEKMALNRAAHDDWAEGENIHQNLLRAYIWVAHYDQNGQAKDSFVSYANVEWLFEPSDMYNDYIAIACNGTGVSNVPENPLMSGIFGHIAREYTCKNTKKNIFAPLSTWPYGSISGIVRYEECKYGSGEYHCDSQKISVRRTKESGVGLDVIQFVSPVNMPVEKCNASTDYFGGYIDHKLSVYGTEYYVSGCQTSNETTVFKGIYYHTKKQWTDTQKVTVNASVSKTNQKASNINFSIGGDVESTWVTEYVQSSYLCPIIIADFNDNNKFVSFKEPIIT